MDPLLSHNGFLVIDKPEGITSHDVVQVVRRHLGIRKVGHLGTLDPMATGVLPIAVGKATRLIEFLMGGTKVYEGAIQLGFSTDTYDRKGQPTSESVVPCTCQEQLDELALQMSGEQLQVAPPFSEGKARAIREMTYTSSCKVFLQTRTRFWAREGLNGFGYTDLQGYMQAWELVTLVVN